MLVLLMTQSNSNGHLFFGRKKISRFLGAMKATLILIFLAFLGVESLPFDAKEVTRLVATVDPKSCNCVHAEQCMISIPYTSFIGISCDYGLQVSIEQN